MPFINQKLGSGKNMPSGYINEISKGETGNNVKYRIHSENTMTSVVWIAYVITQKLKGQHMKANLKGNTCMEGNETEIVFK